MLRTSIAAVVLVMAVGCGATPKSDPYEELYDAAIELSKADMDAARVEAQIAVSENRMANVFLAIGIATIFGGAVTAISLRRRL